MNLYRDYLRAIHAFDFLMIFCTFVQAIPKVSFIQYCLEISIKYHERPLQNLDRKNSQ
jgi:hypothetical protein